MTEPDDAYLWDGSGPVDPEIAALADALRPLDPDVARDELAARRRRRRWLGGAAVVLAAAVAAIALWPRAAPGPPLLLAALANLWALWLGRSAAFGVGHGAPCHARAPRALTTSRA